MNTNDGIDDSIITYSGRSMFSISENNKFLLQPLIINNILKTGDKCIIKNVEYTLREINSSKLVVLSSNGKPPSYYAITSNTEVDTIVCSGITIRPKVKSETTNPITLFDLCKYGDINIGDKFTTIHGSGVYCIIGIESYVVDNDEFYVSVSIDDRPGYYFYISPRYKLTLKTYESMHISNTVSNEFIRHQIATLEAVNYNIKVMLNQQKAVDYTVLHKLQEARKILKQGINSLNSIL